MGAFSRYQRVGGLFGGIGGFFGNFDLFFASDPQLVSASFQRPSEVISRYQGTPDVRFKVEPRDVPANLAARRLGLSLADFEAALPKLKQRGVPDADPVTHNFDLDAIDAWRRSRHARLFGDTARIGAQDADQVAAARLAQMRGAGR